MTRDDSSKPTSDRKPTLAERLFSKVTVDPATKCWVWNGGLDRYGRGRLTINRKNALASRASYETFVGPIGKGLCVCHRCDNPSCINPMHLFTGDHIDNMADMARKERFTQPGIVKLTGADVLEIRRLISEGLSSADVGRKYGISRWRVSAIKLKKTWGHL